MQPAQVGCRRRSQAGGAWCQHRGGAQSPTCPRSFLSRNKLYQKKWFLARVLGTLLKVTAKAFTHVRVWNNTESWENVILFINKVLRKRIISEPRLMCSGCNNRGTGVIIPAGSRIILRHWKWKYIIPFSSWMARNSQAGTALIFKVEQHGGGICENVELL